MSLSSFTNQTLIHASFKRPPTFLRTVFFLQSSGMWSVSSLVKGVRLAGEMSQDSSEHLPPSLTEPKALCACTTGMRGAPWMTWCRSVNSGRRRAFRASVQHNQTLTSLAGIEQTHCNQLIIFFHAYIQGWTSWMPLQEDLTTFWFFAVPVLSTTVSLKLKSNVFLHRQLIFKPSHLID